MTNLKIYYVSDIPITSLEKLNLILAGVGQKTSLIIILLV